MPLFQPQNGWDGKIQLANAGDAAFEDASELYQIDFEENYNLGRRRQLGTRSPGFMPGQYEASGKCNGYFISGAMATKIYGVATPAADRDHAARGPALFNVRIDFASFPIVVRAASAGPPAVTELKLKGYLLSGCYLNTDNYSLQDSTYVEKTLPLMIQRVYDIYDTDTEEELLALLA